MGVSKVRAYTLLSAQGHLLLLTEEDLVAFPELAARFLRGDSLDCPLSVVSSPVNAAEAFLLGNHSILLIEEDSTVAELRIADLVNGLSQSQGMNGGRTPGRPGQLDRSVVRHQVAGPYRIRLAARPSL